MLAAAYCSATTRSAVRPESAAVAMTKALGTTTDPDALLVTSAAFFPPCACAPGLYREPGGATLPTLPKPARFSHRSLTCRRSSGR